jgi:imidazole glycerol-phosphate synthase subunit HisH
VIAIIDYEAGNLTSVARALDNLGIKNSVTSDHREIRRAERIIFPGVGAAGEATQNLKKSGLDVVIKEEFAAGKPILGICLGTQIVMEHSQEDDTACLGIIKGNVLRFPSSMTTAEDAALKIPHMGWNQVNWVRPHPVFKNVPEVSDFYFVHSYYPMPADRAQVIGETEYGIVFPSVIGRKNLVAAQFHPEKSGPVGLSILNNFAQWDGMVDG